MTHDPSDFRDPFDPSHMTHRPIPCSDANIKGFTVSKGGCIVLCAQKPAGLVQSATLTNSTIDSDCRTPSGQIPGDEFQRAIHVDGGKEFEEGRVLRWE